MPGCCGCKYTKFIRLLIENHPELKESVDTFDLKLFSDKINGISHNNSVISRGEAQLRSTSRDGDDPHIRSALKSIIEINNLIGTLPADVAKFYVDFGTNTGLAIFLEFDADRDSDYVNMLEKSIVQNLPNGNKPEDLETFRRTHGMWGDDNWTPIHNNAEGLARYWETLSTVSEFFGIEKLTTHENCPQCETDVILSITPMKQICPLCHNEILACSVCEDDCQKCPHG